VRATGFDLAESAVRLAREHAPSELQVEFRQSDFLADTPQRPFDWVFEHTLFCAIPPERRPDYVEAVRRWLPRGGHYLAVNYFLPLEEAGPPFGVDRAEIHRRFAPHFELLVEWIPRSYPNRVGLERMYWWRKK
jgi:cyclopropane fatty-acyl-phospholipid synthase-like methyltransferase